MLRMKIMRSKSDGWAPRARRMPISSSRWRTP